MSHCLCCNSSLLRHIRQGAVYLYCPECRQEMPETHESAMNISDINLSDYPILKSLIATSSALEKA